MPLKVYYVDDEAELCENFEEYFASPLVEVITFVDAPSALEAIRNSPPDLLFLDYRLVGTTGDEMAKALDPTFPVFLVTGDISIETDYKFRQVFSKPYAQHLIAELIESYLIKRAG
jgi:DNA-binding NtrC family response regulator